MTSDTTIQFIPQPVPSEPVGNLQSVNKSFQLMAFDSNGLPLDNFTFAKPVTITLHYSDQDVQALHEDTILLYYWNKNNHAWEDAATTCTPTSQYIRDPVNNIVAANFCHFTEFALLGNLERKVYIPNIMH